MIQLITTHMQLVWILLVVVALVLAFMAKSANGIWIAVAGLCGLFAAHYNFSWILQVIIVAVILVVLLVGLGPQAKRESQKDKYHEPAKRDRDESDSLAATQASTSLINRPGNVVQVLANGNYQVLVDGQTYVAYSPDTLRMNDRVVVTGQSGSTLTVELG